MSALTGTVLYGCRRGRSICEGEDGLVNYQMRKDVARYLVAKPVAQSITMF